MRQFLTRSRVISAREDRPWTTKPASRATMDRSDAPAWIGVRAQTDGRARTGGQTRSAARKMSPSLRNGGVEKTDGAGKTGVAEKIDGAGKIDATVEDSPTIQSGRVSRRAKSPLIGLLALGLAIPSLAVSQSSQAESEEARVLLERVKTVQRGPFIGLRWFCNDGTNHPPRPYPCGDRGDGHQHGQLSPDAIRLGELGYPVGTLFIALPWEEFFNAEHYHERLRTTALQGYLRRADDGWDFRRAQYYRGARQAEDEEAAGRALLTRLLSDPAWTRKNFLLAVQLVREVPHAPQSSRIDRIRQVSKEIGNAVPAFQPIRVKIHSYPDASDVEAVENFLTTAGGSGHQEALRSLLADLRAYYDRDPAERIEPFLAVDPFRDGIWRDELRALQGLLRNAPPAEVSQHIGDLTARLRNDIETLNDGVANLRRFDLDLVLQELLLQNGVAASGRLANRRQALDVARSLLVGAYGRGLLSRLELAAQLEMIDEVAAQDEVTADRYRSSVRYLERVGLWVQATIESVFGETVERYARIEPVAESFSADLLRATALLPLANVVESLTRDSNDELGVTHTAFGRSLGGAIYGLNPGVARGVLEHVTEAEAATFNYQPDRIYILPQTLADLPPVGGILSLDQGNMLSHLQLLARSLGIPNSVIASTALEAILPHVGEELFYAVSGLGVVILKEIDQLTPDERALLAEKEAGPVRTFRIDEAALNLDEQRVLRLEALDLTRVGAVVGPKAAGVARLQRAFPTQVSPGVALPFGIFRSHLERHRTTDGASLYDEMVAFYDNLSGMERAGRPTSEIDTFVSERLASFRREILRVDLDPGLVSRLREQLAAWGPSGSFGVFVRSDTNVEDLAEFSGAGLNLTVPNQIRFEDILHSIKRVWASPFTERAFAWRRPILENPEHTYVSVLIQRSVPVEKSGVLVTVDLVTGDPTYLTATASEGVGGVVGGEASEALLLPIDGDEPILLDQYKAPFRSQLKMTGEGGFEKVGPSGAERVLLDLEVAALKDLVQTLRERFDPPRDEAGRTLPWDIEFGFLDGALWLFQIRPLSSDSPTAQLAGLAAMDRAVLDRANRPVRLDAPLRERP